MEKQEREHQESSAEVTVKHSKEMKDSGKKRTGDCVSLLSARVDQSV